MLGCVASRVDAVEIGGETWHAEACFAESVKVTESAGMDSERARTLQDWGRHEAETGNAEAGQRMIEEARSTFARLGMTLETDPAERPA